MFRKWILAGVFALGLGWPSISVAGPLNNPTDFTELVIPATDLDLEDTDAGAALGPEINLYRNSASSAINDVGGSIRWHFKEASDGDKVLGANLEIELTDVTAAQSDARMVFDVRSNDALINMLELDGDVGGIAVRLLQNTAVTGTLTADSIISTDNVGTIQAGGTSVTHAGNGVMNVATVILTAEALTVGDGVSLGVGLRVWDLPAGNITIINTFMSVALSGVSVTNDTPDVGVGITIASGTITTLDGTPAFENLLTGQTMTDTNGTVTIASVATHLNVLTGAAHTVHLNFADDWQANADAIAAITGVVRITYIFNEA